MTPVVTVIVATYRAGDYLRQAVASALAQSFPDLELILTDDAADPSVRKLAQDFNDQRVRYRSNPMRLGPAGNHWAAFAESRGRYISILNHDDLWHPGFLASLVPPLDTDPDLTLSFCDHEVIDPDGRTLVKETDETSRRWGRSHLLPGRHQPFRELVVRQTVPLAMGSVFRRSVLDQSALIEVGPAYDLWLTYLLARTGGAAWYSPNRLSQWRIHPTQLTGRGDLNWAMGSLACWQAMADDPSFALYNRQVRQAVFRCAIGAARSAKRVGRLSDARRCAFLAVRNNPANWRSWAIAAWCMLPIDWIYKKSDSQP